MKKKKSTDDRWLRVFDSIRQLKFLHENRYKILNILNYKTKENIYGTVNGDNILYEA